VAKDQASRQRLSGVGHNEAVTGALLLSGAGAYADPWHDFPTTSARIAEVVEDLGIEVRTDDDLERGLAGLSSASPDLLIINAGNPESNGLTPAASGAARKGLADYLATGGPVLAIHAAANTLPDVREWEHAIGGRWVRGISTHPPRDWTTIRIRTDAHPIVAGFADFEVDDERYSFLRTASDIVVLADHEWEGRVHPLCWAREADGVRAVYDGLGHGPESYDSPERRRLLQSSVRWLTQA
jgi:hypothetical protein